MGALVAPGAEATPSQAPAGKGRLPDRITGHDRPSHGRTALELLGDRLPEAALRNGMAAERLREILAEDPTAWLDGDARLYYEDPARTEGSTSSPTAEAAAPAPLDQTFPLHSQPGSQRTIYLDFNGHESRARFGTTGTDWPPVLLGLDPDGDRSTFSTAEREVVQTVWQRVAEDYAPFNVDVTTQDPGPRASPADAADQVYGTRALISPSSNDAIKLCAGGCGGMAYVGVFDITSRTPTTSRRGSSPRPGNDAKNIAEAATHEVGHNLGLTHDGLSGGTSYYAGHGAWAPIMGVGYSRPITQWSEGDYKGANNAQDDLSVIVDNGLPVRPDEEPSGTPYPMTTPPAGSAYITSDSDRDIYLLGICSGSLTLAADPARQSPNLDLKLSLFGVTAGSVAVDNPASQAGTPSRDVAKGMDATVSETVAEDWYFVAVEGVGNGSSINGYDGYASVGAYTLSVNGNCQSDTSNLPSPPQTVQASTDGSSATVAWSPPASTGGSSITHYVVTRDDAAPVTVPAQSRDYTFTDLQPGANDTVAVQAVNEVGEGAPGAVVVKVPATKPGRARIRSAGSGAKGGKVTARRPVAAAALERRREGERLPGVRIPAE